MANTADIVPRVVLSANKGKVTGCPTWTMCKRQTDESFQRPASLAGCFRAMARKRCEQKHTEGYRGRFLNKTIQNANCQGVLHKELFELDNTKRIIKVCYTRRRTCKRCASRQHEAQVNTRHIANT